jgi:hypothetical protein
MFFREDHPPGGLRGDSPFEEQEEEEEDEDHDRDSMEPESLEAKRLKRQLEENILSRADQPAAELNATSSVQPPELQVDLQIITVHQFTGTVPVLIGDNLQFVSIQQKWFIKRRALPQV